MLEGARNDICATTHHGLQSLGAAREIDNFGVQTFVFEVALDIGNGQRQVINKRLAAHSDSYFFFFKRLSACKAGNRGCGTGGAGGFEEITPGERKRVVEGKSVSVR